MNKILSVLPAMRHKNFRLFVAGQSVSLIGTWMTTAAMGWLVYRLTRSAFLLGAVGFASQVPCFLLAPYIGVYVDRLNRRKVLLWTQAIPLLQSLMLAYLTFSRHVSIHWVLGLSLLQGIVTAFDFPARHSFLAEMVPDRRDLGNAIAINSTMFNAARLLGPSLAGLIIAASNEGWCFLIDAASYAAVIVSLAAMRLAPRRGVSAESAWAAFRDGWNYVAGHMPIRTILVLMAIAGLTGIPSFVLMPIFAAQVLHGGANTLGFLMGGLGLGCLISALSLTMRNSVRGLVKMIPIGGVAFGVGLAGFGLSRNFWLSIAIMAIVGFGMMQLISICNTTVQMLAQDEKRGRVMSFFTMAYMGMPPFGSLMAGSLARAIGAPHTMMLIGAALTLAALWFAASLPALQREIKPIYEKMGIVPADLPPALEEVG